MRLSFGRRINRRRDLRVPVECEVTLRSSDGSGPIHRGLSSDVSLGGMQILTDHAYDVHSRLVLAFDCKALGWGTVSSCAASVMWVDPHPIHGRRRFGVKFDNPDW